MARPKIDINHVIRLRPKDMADATWVTCPTCEAGKRRKKSGCDLCEGTGKVPAIR